METLKIIKEMEQQLMANPNISDFQKNEVQMDLEIVEKLGFLFDFFHSKH